MKCEKLIFHLKGEANGINFSNTTSEINAHQRSSVVKRIAELRFILFVCMSGNQWFHLGFLGPSPAANEPR